MNIREVVDAALATTHGNQAELARRLQRSGPAITRWLDGTNKPDLESCLRLAAIIGKPPEEVARAAGFDPALLHLSSVANLPLTPIEQDVLRRVRRIQAAIDATEGIPDQFVEAVLMPMLKGTEDNMLATIEAVKLMRQREPPVSTAGEPSVSTPEVPDNADSTRPDPDLATSYLGRPVSVLVGVK